jgi:Fe-S cluster assembly scaffold protein SufB
MSNTQKIVKVFTNKSTSKNLNFNVKEGETVNIILYIIAKSAKVNYKLCFNHKPNSKVNVICNCIANCCSNIKVTFSNNIKKNDNDCVIKQQINGILLDNNSTIYAEPSLIIGNNKLKADHEVNIGGINKENLFYLMSRGINETKAKKILIEQMFSKAKTSEYSNLLI